METGFIVVVFTLAPIKSSSIVHVLLGPPEVLTVAGADSKKSKLLIQRL